MKGVSTEGLAVIIESSFAMIVGIIIGFIYSWRLSLVAFACTPFMAVGGAVNAKFQAGMTDVDENDYKEANLLSGDAVTNYKTVASFAHYDLVIKDFKRHLEAPLKAGYRKAHCIGFWFGFSQFTQ